MMRKLLRWPTMWWKYRKCPVMVQRVVGEGNVMRVAGSSGYRYTRVKITGQTAGGPEMEVQCSDDPTFGAWRLR